MTWERADHDLIVAAVRRARRAGARVDLEVAILDLRRRAWRALEEIDPRPTAAELAEAWGWSKSTAADLLVSHDRWVDPRHRPAWDAFIGGRHGPGRPGLAWATDEGRDLWCSALTMHGALEAAREAVAAVEQRLADAVSDGNRTTTGHEPDANRSRSGDKSDAFEGASDANRTTTGHEPDANRHTRGSSGFTEHGARSTEEEEHTNAPAPAAARVRPPPSPDVLRVWTAYRDLQMQPPPDAAPTWRGTRRADEPPKGWGVADRVREHGAEAMLAVVEWAHRSMHQRAVHLRAGGYLGETLFRPSKTAEYVPIAEAWVANGRRDGPPPRGRDSPGRPPRMDLDELNRQTLELIRQEAEDAHRRDDPRDVHEPGAGWTHPAA